MSIEKGPGHGVPEEEKTPEVEVVGECSFDDVDDANVPVDILLSKEEDDDGNETGFYTLRAGDYMPRKMAVSEGLFEVRSKNPEALRKIVREKIIPIYQTALAKLEAIANGNSDNLYYWEENKPDEASSKEQK